MSLSVLTPYCLISLKASISLGRTTVAPSSVDGDDAETDHPVEGGVVVDQSLGLGDRHPVGLLRGPAARDRGLQAEHVAEILALLPRAEHLVHVGDVVTAIEHRGDQPQPGQVGVVEQRDAADPQRRMQQAAVAVDADVARGGARQPRELLDPVLAGRRDAVGLHGRVEQLRHRVLDDVARTPPDLPRRTTKPVEDRRDRARLLPRLLGGRHVRPTN